MGCTLLSAEESEKCPSDVTDLAELLLCRASRQQQTATSKLPSQKNRLGCWKASEVPLHAALALTHRKDSRFDKAPRKKKLLKVYAPDAPMPLVSN